MRVDSDWDPRRVDGLAEVKEVKEGRGEVCVWKGLRELSEISAVSEIDSVGVGFGSSPAMGVGEGDVGKH